MFGGVKMRGLPINIKKQGKKTEKDTLSRGCRFSTMGGRSIPPRGGLKISLPVSQRRLGRKISISFLVISKLGYQVSKEI